MSKRQGGYYAMLLWEFVAGL